MARWNKKTTNSSQKNIADVNNDGKVDEKDLSIVHTEYAKEQKNAEHADDIENSLDSEIDAENVTEQEVDEPESEKAEDPAEEERSEAIPTETNTPKDQFVMVNIKTLYNSERKCNYPSGRVKADSILLSMVGRKNDKGVTIVEACE